MFCLVAQPCCAPRARRAPVLGSPRGGRRGPAAPRAAARAATKTDSKPAVDTKTKTQRPWNVIVHDDPVSLMSYVTRVFMDVFRYSQAKAHKLMMEVHTAGKSVVWTGPREQAETYVTRLQAFHLLATLELTGD